jgi:serine/threonine-protein kinase
MGCYSAIVVSSGAHTALPEGLFAPYELVREISSRRGVYVVRLAGAAGAKPQFAVAEWFAGFARAGDAKGEQMVREARRIATLTSPNVARIREMTVRGEDVVVFGELIDGEKLIELWRPDGLPFEIAVRVIIDVLAGAGALHGLRDAKQQPMKLSHGEISPATILFGLDGVARVLHAVARRVPGAPTEAASVGYLAPEVLSGEPYDQRADVFGAGVLLWEALSGKRLSPESDGPAIAARLRASPVPAAGVPEKAGWARGLVDVAARALAAAPDDRWPTAAAMAAEVRKAAGLKLAPASTAAAFAKSAMGERVKARRARLEGGGPDRSPSPPAASPPAPRVSPVAAPAASDAHEDAPISISLDSIPPSVPPPASGEAESVLVAPGLRAPVADVVELGSDLLEAAPPSIVPPAPSPAPAPPPPLPPAPALPVVAIGTAPAPADDAPPPVSGAPHFAAAIDVPSVPATLFAGGQPFATAASPVEPGEIAAANTHAERRRKAFVLGGVGALGALIFVLAAVRMAHRDGDAAASAPRATTATVAASVVPASPPPSTAAVAVTPPPKVAPPPATVAAATPPPAPSPAGPAIKTKPRPVTAPPPPPPPPRPAAPAPARPKPRPKPAFDPNSL